MAKKKKMSSAAKEEAKLIIFGEKVEATVINKVKHFLHLHVDNFQSSHGKRIEGFLFFINFLAIVLFVIETHNIPPTVHKYLFAFEMVLVSIFVLEYIMRMWVAEKKVKHAFNIYSIIDILAILPVLVNFINLTFLRIFRILRLFRLLRVLRFQRMLKGKNTMFGELTDVQFIVARIGLIVFTIIFVFAGLIWSVESKINPGVIKSIWSALYFAVVTLSTVGYGDIAPLSSYGRAITMVMIITGIAVIPWYLGKLVKVIIKSGTKEVIDEEAGITVPANLVEKIVKKGKDPSSFVKKAILNELKK